MYERDIAMEIILFDRWRGGKGQPRFFFCFFFLKQNVARFPFINESRTVKLKLAFIQMLVCLPIRDPGFLFIHLAGYVPTDCIVEQFYTCSRSTVLD